MIKYETASEQNRLTFDKHKTTLSNKYSGNIKHYHRSGGLFLGHGRVLLASSMLIGRLKILSIGVVVSSWEVRA